VVNVEGRSYIQGVELEKLLDEVARRLAIKVKEEEEHLRPTAMLWRTMRVRQVLHESMVQRTLEEMVALDISAYADPR
jgi:hypothetical protein